MKLRYRPVPGMPDHKPVVWFASPGNPETLTGGYIYNACVIGGLEKSGWVVHRLRLPDSFPFPKASDQVQAQKTLSVVGRGDLVVIDGLAFGAFAEDVLESIPGTLVALVHHPLADESGLSEVQSVALAASERTALRYAAGVIVTSPHTLNALVKRFDVSKDTIWPVVPGVARVVPSWNKSDPPLLLSVGSLTVRKGHDILVKALAEVSDLHWRAVIVGSKERDCTVADEIGALIGSCGLSERVSLLGELPQSELAAYYADAIIFMLATRHEGYGMVFSEAMIHGLPIVSCAVGAVPDTVPESAGLLVPADDVQAFASVLRTLLIDSEIYTRLATGSSAAALELPTWEDTAAAFARALLKVEAK